jgi:hypothetical protein
MSATAIVKDSIVGRPILAAEVGCGQDCPPHKDDAPRFPRWKGSCV